MILKKVINIVSFFRGQISAEPLLGVLVEGFFSSRSEDAFRIR